MARGRRRVRRVVDQTIVKQVTVGRARRRKGKARGKTQSRQSRGLMGSSMTASFARSLADPWSMSSCIPDGANGTGCFSIKQSIVLGTGTGTCVSFVLNPQSITNNQKVDTASTAATPTLTGNYTNAPQSASIQALYGSVRVVSAGIKVRYVGNTQTDQGILVIGQFAEDYAPSNLNGASLTTFQNAAQNYKIYPLRSGASLTWRPQSVDDCINFWASTSAAAALSSPPSGPWLAFAVYGATANTASLVIADAVTNFEGQFISQTFLPGGLEAIAKPAEAGWYETAVNAVRLLDPIVPYVSSTLSNVFNSPGFQAGAMQMLTGTVSQRGMPSSSRRMLNYMQPD